MGSKEKQLDSPRAASRRNQIIWGIAICGIAWLAKKMQQGDSIVNPPFCAWRFVGNHDAWNVAFPDMRSMYHVMQMNINEGDVFKITADSFPYARYMSYQTYELRRLMSHQSLRDVDMIPENGPNAFANLTAAVNGEKQGGYTIYITAHGDHNLTNELRALADGVNVGQFDLFFRIYVEISTKGPPQAPWGHKPAYDKDNAFEWGWAPPPKVYVKRAHSNSDEFHEISFCRYRRRSGFKLLAYLSEVWSPPPNPFPDHLPSGPNKQNNVFLPKYSDREGKFASKDANYVASVAEITDETPHIWARVKARLPRTPGGLYSPPYVANGTDYDVRYVSISSVHRTIPFRGHGTVSDTNIIEHYQAKYGEDWDWQFTVWIVPPEAESYPPEVLADDALILKWGKSIWHGKTITHPGILFRQVMAQRQVLVDNPLHASGVINIVPERCRGEQIGGAGVADGDIAMDDHARLERVCCGKEAPRECFLPSYVEHRLGAYYPKVEYFTGSPEGPLLYSEEEPSSSTAASS